MKYRVNLFPQELKPRLELVTFGFTLVVWLLCIIFVGLVTYFYQSSYSEIQQNTRKVQQQHNSQKSLLDTLTAARDKRVQDPKLLAQVDKLQGELRAKQLLLNELQGREQLKNQGFSLLMKDLAEQHIQEIWLTRININERLIRVEGGSVDSSKVPFWVSRLKNTEYFEGRDFAGARMYRNDADELFFVLSSDLAELSLPSANDTEEAIQ